MKNGQGINFNLIKSKLNKDIEVETTKVDNRNRKDDS